MIAAALMAPLLGACVSSPPPAVSSLLRVGGNRLYLPVTLNGAETQALLDSGAEMTLVHAGFASEAGLTAFGADVAKGTGAGTQSVQFAEGVTLAAAGVELREQMVAIMDLTDISERVVGYPLTVVLGRELFDAGIFEIDISQGHFARISPDDVPMAAPLPLSDANGIKQVEVVVAGVPVMADFDLGNGNEMLLSPAFAERAGLLAPDNILGTKSGGGIGGPVERTLVSVPALEIGGHSLTGLTAAVGPKADGADANIGVSILREFRIVADFAGNRIWLEPLR